MSYDSLNVSRTFPSVEGTWIGHDSSIAFNKISYRNEKCGDWWKNHDEKLHNFYISPNILKVVTWRLTT